MEQLVSTGKAAARTRIHARTLLLADTFPGPLRTDDDIVAALGIGPRTIARVRQRFVTEGFQAGLDHKPQPPRPDKIKSKGNVEQQLIRLACTDPPQGRCHWTLNLLADELVALGLVKSVNTATVRQALMVSARAQRKGSWRKCSASARAGRCPFAQKMDCGGSVFEYPGAKGPPRITLHRSEHSHDAANSSGTLARESR